MAHLGSNEMKQGKTLNTKDMVICALFTALIAVGAFIKIPIPYVPITLQFLFTNIAGLLLGKRRGLISVGLYIVLGLVGLPIFTQGGGFGYVFQPTFGYILGFALGTWLAGFITERGTDNIKTYIIAGLVDFTAVFTLGLSYFYLILNYYLLTPIVIEKLFVICFFPFALGDIALVIISAILAKRLRPVALKGLSAD